MVEFYSFEELAEVMRVTPKALRSLIDKGTIPHSKLNGRIVCEKGQLQEFLTLSRRVSAVQAVERNHRVLNKRDAVAA